MFNETNTIEEMLIAAAVGQGWEYRTAAELERSTSSVLLETVLQDALLRLNPITRDQAGQVINSLRTVIIGFSLSICKLTNFFKDIVIFVLL